MPAYLSFIVPTCGRAAKQPGLLNEALYWLVNQDYSGDFEVLVFNDAPGQTLVCDHPRVKVFNWPERISDLGTKYNLMIEAAGDIIIPSEDDDISLLHRASQAVSKLDSGPIWDYWSPKKWIYAQKGRPAVVDGNGWGFNCSAFRRGALLGRSPAMFCGHDRELAKLADEHLLDCPDSISPAEVSYIYRWGVSDMHLSGCSDPETAYKNYHPGKPGTYYLIPTKYEDWTQIAADAASRAT